jgi:hypothetical protein
MRLPCCLFLCVFSLTLLPNGSVNSCSEYIHKRKTAGRDVFYVVRVVSHTRCVVNEEQDGEVWSWPSTGPETKNDYADEDQHQYTSTEPISYQNFSFKITIDDTKIISVYMNNISRTMTRVFHGPPLLYAL